MDKEDCTTVYPGQAKGLEIVIEALSLNGFSVHESTMISWNVFMNLFRRYHQKPTYENFSRLVDAMMEQCKQRWDEESQ